ncbi:hypothetical protein G6F56_001016 [Rhizopus delemar]|nr:hypothetical protein G6F56_001016 [Rhizopus delemar]
MDWVSSSEDPHNEVLQLLTLSTFKPSTTGSGKKSGDVANNSGSKSKTRGSAALWLYRKYTEQQVNDLLRMVFLENKFDSEAGRETGIVVRTAQGYVRKARILIEEERKAALGEVASDEEVEAFQGAFGIFLDFYERKPDATLAQARDAVMEAFPGLEITVSAISKHIAKHCNLTMKKPEKLPEARNDISTLEKRKKKIEEWMALQDFDHGKNCVFIDEAGLNLNIKRTFGRSERGTLAKAIVSTQRGVSITILGAMCERGIVNITLRRPTAVVSKKKRKLEFAESGLNVVNDRIGTRTTHYLQFLASTMDILDQNDMKGRFLVMDNTPIHRSPEMQNLISSRGYRCIYLPLYSPFLNPIEEMWSKIKFGVRRNDLTEKGTLVPRIVEASREVTVADCEGWIRHAQSFFDRCLNMEPKL